MIKIKDIAKKAGVSTATVSLALHGGGGRKRVSENLTETIRNIADKLNYRPNSAARMMATKKTKQIGILLRNAPDMPKRNLANFETILGIGEYLSERNYLQVLVPLGRLKAEINSSSRIFNEQVLDGIIAMDVLPSKLYAFIRRSFDCSVFLDTNYWNKSSCLRRDEKKAGSLAAAALMNSGYRKIIYIGSGREKHPHFSVLERIAGIMDTVGDAGEVETVDVDAIEKLVCRGSHLSSDIGVICYDSMIARYVFSTFSQAGYIPPDNYGLISCDDSHDTELSFPALSRVDYDRYGMGKLAAQMVVDSIDSPDCKIPSRLLDVSLIPGKTIREGFSTSKTFHAQRA